MTVYYNSLDEACSHLRKSESGNVVERHLTAIFNVFPHEIDAFEKRERAYEKFMASEKNVLDRSELQEILRKTDAIHDFGLSEEEADAIFSPVKGEELRDFFQDKGKAFFKNAGIDVEAFSTAYNDYKEAESAYREADKRAYDAYNLAKDINILPEYVKKIDEDRDKWWSCPQTDRQKKDALFMAYVETSRWATRMSASKEKRTELEAIESDLAKAKEAERTANESIKSHTEELYNGIVGSLLNQSPVSQEDAEQWFNSSVKIDAGVNRKLKKLEYPLEDFKRDLTELYRISGGRIGPVVFESARGNRASSDGKTVVNVTSRFTKKTLFHEVGHVLEGQDSAMLKASFAFIQGRATGAPQSLSRLCPEHGYRKNEMAFPDTFQDPYVGKIYKDSNGNPFASEVISMAFGAIASEEGAAKLAANDAGQLHLMIGNLITPRDSVKERVDDKAKSFAEKKQSAEETRKRQQAWEKALDKVAGKDLELLLKTVDSSNNPVPFHGYVITDDAWGTRISLNRRDEYGDFTCVGRGKPKGVRRLAYWIIAREFGLFNTESITANGVVPDTPPFTPPVWFDPEKGLPAIDGVKSFSKSRKSWLKELEKKATPELIEKLKREDGYQGYRFSDFATRVERDFSETDERHIWRTERWRINVTRITSKDEDKLRAMYCYLAIANKLKKLPVALRYGEEGTIMDNLEQKPIWFNGPEDLPEI